MPPAVAHRGGALKINECLEWRGGQGTRDDRLWVFDVSRLRLLDDGIVAEVCDTGPGIPSEERVKVFRRFCRRDASRATEGAGLGLALVAAIATLHEARCFIPDSDSGLRVRLVLPALSKSLKAVASLID
ncbi:sensor histidine kinase [Sphingomonas phyllosphaerae]|uniref:sensor histidine kinase n=1 Tax=Sphingomonas phyllosphaerae TaxID=257003 RepID=UPI002412F5DD|nr:ATP-binding protein [Sphingomonas phyllosphaerae]